jgi:hypothetical protein
MSPCRMSKLKKMAVVVAVGMALASPFSSCASGQFTTVQTVSLDTRTIITYLIGTAILNPLNNWIMNAVNTFFDQAENT